MFDDAALIRVAVQQRGCEVLRLFQLDVRRQGWHVGVGLEFDQHGAVGGEGLFPGGGHPVFTIHVDTLEADGFGEAVIGHVGDVLRGFEFRIAFHHPLFPGDLVEVLVVEHAADPLRVLPFLPVLGHGDQFGHVVHLHRAVTHYRHHRALGVRELGGDRIGHGGAHGGQAAR